MDEYLTTETVVVAIGAVVLIIIGLLTLLFQALARAWSGEEKKEKGLLLLPPGPRGLPVVGNLLMLGHQPHRDLHKLAQKYGDIMRLRFGLMPVIVVSSPQAAELFLKTHDLVFASRPRLEIAEYVAYHQQSLSASPYGSYWRNMRKMCTLELLSNLKINSFKSMRKEELCLLIRSIKEAAAANCVAVDLSAKVLSLSSDMSYRMMLGKKYSDINDYERGFKALIREAMHIAATFNLSDFIPQIKFLDVQGLRKRMKRIAKVFDAFLEKIIEEHIVESAASDSDNINESSKTDKDFVDVMLGFMGSEESEYRLERDNVKAIILDMLIASMDTSACTIEWTLSELIKHPRAKNKLQKEIENVVGMERMVEESDLEKLDYLNMVVKESLRLHPVVPFLLPHASIQDCTVNGFHIPQNSRICINAWAIGRDPNVWSEPDKFFPERFVGSDIDLRGRHFQLIPFGSGRRGCPGMQLGLTIVRLVVAQLVHCFNWELPNGRLVTELDMTEDFGLVCARAQHLLAIPTWRLRNEIPL